MGKNWPNYPSDVNDGDEPSHSPNKSQNSLLGTERGSDFTRRIETDANNNLYVRVAADDTADAISVSPLVVGSATSVPATTLTTIATYSAVAITRLTRISCSGTVYAKFQLFKNTALIDTVRSGPDRSIVFDFKAPLVLAASDVLDVKVTHYNTSLLEDFEATIYGA